MSINEIKDLIERDGSYTGAVPSLHLMYYHGFKQKKGVWSKKDGEYVNQTQKLRESITGPGVYNTDIKFTVVNSFTQKLREQGHDVTTKRVGETTEITWRSKDDEFTQIFSKLNLQECLVVKKILDAHVDRLTQ